MPKKEYVRNMFDRIAGDYDSLNHIMSLNIDKIWRRKALREIIDAQQPQKILDLACGTGDFSLAIAGKMSDGSHITGLDLSDGMLAVMRQKVARAGLDSRIDMMQGDSLCMPFEDGTFDVVTIAFGIRNFEDRPACLREILRVLKPGGKLVILELSVPSNGILRWCYNLYFKHILPWIGGLFSGDKAAYRYLPGSVIAFPGKEEWISIEESCGFANVRHKAFTLGICRMYTAVRPDQPAQQG